MVRTETEGWLGLPRFLRCLWRTRLLDRSLWTPLQKGEKSLTPELTNWDILKQDDPLPRSRRALGEKLFFPINDTSFGQVVWRHLHRDGVARENADEVQPHLAANMREHGVSILQFNPKHRVGQQLLHGSVHSNHIFVFGQVKISGSVSVINTICSK